MTARKEVIKVEATPSGIELSAGGLEVLRGLPEIAGIAAPGEVLRGVQCEPAHYLVLFWPLLTQNPTAYGQRWELGPAILYDIDTTAKGDDPGSGRDSNTNHFSRVVRFRMGEGGEYGLGDAHAYGYDGAFFGGTFGRQRLGAGMVCRGDASFSNDPFRCVMMLRMWHVQTVESRAIGSKSSTTTQKWWQGAQGKSFLYDYPRAKCIVVPTAGTTINRAYVIPIDPEWVELERAGKWTEKKLWRPAASEAAPSAVSA